MKTLNAYLFVLSNFIIMPVIAQVKIGSNPTTIHPNSILEMESTSKGLLCPRVAINDVNNPSPLTAPIEEGMLVYNSTGTEENGFYFWNGAKWLQLLTDSEIRSNHVIVKSESDLPAPISGTITLAANTCYEINGTINLSSKIDLNGCTIMGKDHMNDKLVYAASSDELFTGSNGGTLKMITVSAPNAGAQLFDLDMGGTETNLIIQNCVLAGCDNLGNIKNSTGYILFTDLISAYNTNGITFENLSRLHLNNFYWTNTNSNIYEKFIGTFHTIRIAGGSSHVLSANSAVSMDISGITSIVVGDLKQRLFVGDGTYYIGVFSKQWETEAHGIASMKDQHASGNLYITTPAANPIIFTNVPEKVLGTTTAVNLFRIITSGNNRLIYDGLKTRYFTAVASLSIASASSSKNFSFYIAKNGVVLEESKQTLRLSASTDKGSLTLSCNVQLSTSDYIEVFVKNETDNTSITVTNMNVAIN
jgi:hypothetical protein